MIIAGQILPGKTLINIFNLCNYVWKGYACAILSLVVCMFC